VLSVKHRIAQFMGKCATAATFDDPTLTRVSA
jgi:hypothetical protein